MTKPLFPEIIPVTQAEIDAWLDRVPNLSCSKSRRESYAKAYNVADKVRAAKLRGEWPNPPENPNQARQ